MKESIDFKCKRLHVHLMVNIWQHKKFGALSYWSYKVFAITRHEICTHRMLQSGLSWRTFWALEKWLCEVDLWDFFVTTLWLFITKTFMLVTSSLNCDFLWLKFTVLWPFCHYLVTFYNKKTVWWLFFHYVMTFIRTAYGSVTMLWLFIEQIYSFVAIFY